MAFTPMSDMPLAVLTFLHPGLLLARPRLRLRYSARSSQLAQLPLLRAERLQLRS